MSPSTFNFRFGIWACIACILLAVAYLIALVATGASASGFPPVAPYDVLISLITLLSAVSILVLFAVIHASAPDERKLLSLIALSFATLFAGLTSINRFTHLAIVRPASAAGVTDGIQWFTPYGATSIMTGLEFLAWGFFLGLAFVFLAPVFRAGRLERALFWLLLINGILCLVSVLALPTGISWLTYVGAIAWGPGFIVVPALLIALFRHKLAT
jgi:hypothetical protein